MENSCLRQTIRYLVQAAAAVSLPAGATTAVDTDAVQAPVTEVSYRLINFLTLEMVLLGGLVLLAFVFIARRPETR